MDLYPTSFGKIKTQNKMFNLQSIVLPSPDKCVWKSNAVKQSYRKQRNPLKTRQPGKSRKHCAIFNR